MSTILSPSWSYADAVKVVKDAETASQPKGPPKSPTTGVNDNANNAQGANNGGSSSSSMMGMLLTAGGGLMIAQGSSTTPPNMPLIAAGVVLVGMGLMSFKQSKADKKAANQAGMTGNQSDAYDDTYSNNGGLVDTSAQAVAEDKAVKDLEKAGIYNPKTGKITAGGKAYSASDFASKESMAAAGIPPGAIAGAMAYADKEGKKIAEKVKLGAMTASNGYVEGSSAGGGGGAGAYPGTPTDAYGAGGMGAGGAGGSGATREPTNLAGMQKNYNGEPIGVSADSIFNMMARRYKVKDSQESFYSDTDLALQK